MKPFIQIALTTGHVYEVATEVIAQNRAKAMLELHKDEFANIEEALADTRELFDDGYEVSDWAKNNMNPSDYLPTARLVRFTPPEQDFVNSAEWTHHDHAALVGELDGEQVMRQPVEAVMTAMGASGQIANVAVMHGADRKAFGAIAVFLGPDPVVGSFIQAIEFTANHLTGGAPAAPKH